ncbi:hypothetical protein E4U10_006763 [Claviceps purpurea]|nr:hypothetical protein E4U10_006763 [Claviceps purpurea]
MACVDAREIRNRRVCNWATDGPILLRLFAPRDVPGNVPPLRYEGDRLQPPAGSLFYVHQRHARGDSQGATILTWSRCGRDSTNPSTRTSRVGSVLSSKQVRNTFPTTSAGLRNESKTRLDREEWPAAYADFTALLWGFDVQLNCRTRICGQARVRAWARPIYHNPILCRIGLSPARH